MRSRNRRPEHNFEVVAGKVIGFDDAQHRFAFARNGASEEQFARALVRAGVRDPTPATVLSDGDAGSRNLQSRVLPEATVVLDWSHIAMRFEHVLSAATVMQSSRASMSIQLRETWSRHQMIALFRCGRDPEEAPIVPHFVGMRGVCGPCQSRTICWSWDQRTGVFPFGTCKWAGGGMTFMDTHQLFVVLRSRMIWLFLEVETRPCVSGTGHLECACMC